MKQDLIYIAFASESGNAQRLAEDFAKRCDALKVQFHLLTLNELVAQPFAKSQVVFFVSTTGNGDFPANGKDFINQAQGLENDLSMLRFALFALGSQAYTHFCGAGKKLEILLSEELAQSMRAPVFAGDNFDVLYASWALELLSDLSGECVETIVEQMEAFAQKPQADYRLVEQRLLTQPESDQQTFHLVLEPKDEGLTYQPGDVVSLSPANEVSRVQQLLKAMSLKGSEKIECDGESYTVAYYLANLVELSKISADVVKKTGALKNDWDLLTAAANDKSRAAFLGAHDVLSWWLAHPLSEDHKLEWLSSLLPKTPRYYSVTSSKDLVGEQLHLTVGLHRQHFSDQRVHYGLGSGYLCQQLQSQEIVSLSLEAHPNFYLQNKAPMIWVAAGTGIAPFIGFLMQLMRVFPSERPKVTLYFGVRHPEQDFLYQSFLKSCVDEGLLVLKMAFSRLETQKQYVQHLMVEDMSEIAKVLQQDGHVYVCGSKPMWEDVEAVLQHAVVSGSTNMDVAKNAWIQFSENALHKEIY